MRVGDRIKDRRQELGMTVDEVVEKLKENEKLNINRATIYRYENNETERFPITILEPLAKVLKTTPAALMGWDDHPASGDELKIAETYYKAKVSDKETIKALVRAIDKILGINEQYNDDTK